MFCLKNLTLILLAVTFMPLAGCSFPPRIFRIDVRQGNYLSPEMLTQLKVGMEKSAVVELMGTPALSHFFEKDRWDYYYYLKPGQGGAIQEKSLSLFFKGDKLSRIVHKS
ncbi:MAG: outer membrane protein assembly factor BamE [Gammaproteobacteria bacterium]|nr:outer membrane protein assembly factor BamE [Gammaproteobacteria bacterium]